LLAALFSLLDFAGGSDPPALAFVPPLPDDASLDVPLDAVALEFALESVESDAPADSLLAVLPDFA
jgi:hypothetical protein